MDDEWHPESGPQGFLAATTYQARSVLDADDGWPTYEAGLEFQGLAMNAMATTPKGEFLPDTPTALNLIWGALTDEMDAPGRGSPEQDAAAVRHMKQAATEWLEKMGTPEDRSAFCDRWVHDECGYERG
ncbi:hypothetical protein [Winogradskya humida]|uniref:Uncharacterized protein n=1 Tax=Winogradskya humida TaxID=113566 RepID=A0ABQ4A273_9ACTN|nr:hypothetical protein [Actinoplanes humidus]GIE24959.1 hypothetical protein Ahu01nite_080610 [Actinoplanes humidus]